MTFTFCRLEPHWQPIATVYQNRRLSPALKAWIVDFGSMTKRLRALVGSMQIAHLHQYQEQASFFEKKSLVGHPPFVFVRETDLMSTTQLLIKARTVVPCTKPHPQLLRLRHLGQRPLGELLFAQPHSPRSRMRWCLLYPHQLSPDFQFTRTIPYLIGRESLFYFDHLPLLLTEIFMPDLIYLICANQYL